MNRLQAGLFGLQQAAEELQDSFLVASRREMAVLASAPLRFWPIEGQFRLLEARPVGRWCPVACRLLQQLGYSDEVAGSDCKGEDRIGRGATANLDLAEAGLRLGPAERLLNRFADALADLLDP
ncbi:hypothetical protein [Sphingosinicella sp. BN140058]|uniref:hypothetical protein n=1 Tax=Sphingosinicella sp. BN140058 TaxID=1892855 RepID=UPI00352AD7FD